MYRVDTVDRMSLATRNKTEGLSATVAPPGAVSPPGRPGVFR